MSKELGYITTDLKTFLCTNCGKILRGKMSVTLILEDDYGVPIEGRDIENLDTRYNSFTCPNCEQEYGMVEIDSEIVDIISLLNKKGFTTGFCCQGHAVKMTMSRLIKEDYCPPYHSIPKYEHSNPYIAFDIGAIAKNATDTLVKNRSELNIRKFYTLGTPANNFYCNLDLQKFMGEPVVEEGPKWEWDSTPIHDGEYLSIHCYPEDPDNKLSDFDFNAICEKAVDYLRDWVEKLPDLYNVNELEAWINER